MITPQSACRNMFGIYFDNSSYCELAQNLHLWYTALLATVKRYWNPGIFSFPHQIMKHLILLLSKLVNQRALWISKPLWLRSVFFAPTARSDFFFPVSRASLLSCSFSSWKHALASVGRTGPWPTAKSNFTSITQWNDYRSSNQSHMRRLANCKHGCKPWKESLRTRGRKF